MVQLDLEQLPLNSTTIIIIIIIIIIKGIKI